MNPIRVLIIHRDNDHYRSLSGWWSSPVPEFIWQTRKVPPVNFHLDLKGMEKDFDLVVMEDWIFGEIRNRNLPLAYVIVDSARSPRQLAQNMQQSKYTDLLLVDSDDLRKFKTVPSRPIRRFAHAVRTELFYPREKQYDVGFLCWPTPERREVADHLEQFCKERGYSFLTGTWADAEGYANAIGSARIVVHKSHIVPARSWRVFDVMASQGCLLSTPLPSVSGDGIADDVHYFTWHSFEQLEKQIDWLLNGDWWKESAKDGYELVMARHTWPVRAAELRQMVNDVFGWSS